MCADFYTKISTYFNYYKLILFFTMLFFFTGCDRETSNGYPITPVQPSSIEMRDNFWQPRLETFRSKTLPHVLEQCIETGRVENFVLAAGQATGQQYGIYPFDDSDVFKLMEGISVWLSYHDDPSLERTLDSLIAIIAAAQEPDGYLYTVRRNQPDWLERRSGKERWSNLAWSHELYNAGHLYLAAAAHFEATGKLTLLNVAYRNADLIVRVFGPTGLNSPPGHQVIEMGLVALYRLSGNNAYLDLAKFFLDCRGRHEHRSSWGTYAQDHLPILEQTEAVGHAVRAAYMYAGMLDVSAFSGSREYARASLHLWENVVGKKIYLTGGLGAVGFGERFSENYDLPNLSAYQETCASIANIMWNHRLFLYTGHGKYLDVMERTLYNAFLAGISQSGDTFFYPNPLASRGYHERHSWFPCACCPTNVSRFFPAIPGLFYAFKDNIIYVNLFASSQARIPAGNDTITLMQHSEYPWSGKVKLRIGIDRPVELELCIRIPGWAKNNALPSELYRFLDPSADPTKVEINKQAYDFKIEDGFIRLNRVWHEGDSLMIEFPMIPQKILAHQAVSSDSGRFALQYGPLVYCLESSDQETGHALPLSIAKDAPITGIHQRDLFNGVTIITSAGERSIFSRGIIATEPAEIRAIPYYLWANRGMSEMVVWIPAESRLSEPFQSPPLSTVAQTSSSGGSGILTVNDQKVGDRLQHGFIWSDTNDTVWIRYDFPDEEEFSEVSVYWLTSGQNPKLAVPLAWKVLALVEGEWHQVYNYAEPWGTDPDRFNRVIFETVRTRSLKLEARPTPGYQCGLVEWGVN